MGDSECVLRKSCGAGMKGSGGARIGAIMGVITD